LLLGTLAALLHRYTQQTEIALDLQTSDATGTHAVGFELALAGNSSISQVIDEAQRQLAAAVHSANAMDRRANIAVTFIAAPGELAISTEAGSRFVPAASAYDVHFVFAQTPDGDRLALVYNARLFRAHTAQQLLESYVVMHGAVRRDSATTVEWLPLVSQTGIRALTVDQDSGTATYPLAPVHRSFEALAKKQPMAVAASFQGQRITYRELDERSSQLANCLVARGAQPGDAIAVCIRPCLDILVAILAIWKSRGIYLPLDPTHPEALIGRMLEEARPRLVLTSSNLCALTKNVPQLHLDADAGVLRQFATVAPAIEPRLDDSAYLFYTSGTTGKPKGVVATQGNLAQYIHSAAQKYGFGPGDVFSSLARYTFSISMFELVSPICCGASLRILDRDEVLSPERLYQALDEVTVLHAGPSLLGSLFRHLRSAQPDARTLPRMRHASSGGDLVSPSVMEEMKRVFPHAELFVIYGCTEISCMGTSFPIPRETAVARTFVGKPFPNVTLRVLDSNRNLVPFGVVGEICYAGNGIVPGYLDRPELTAEKFVEIEGLRFYRTGDVGRLHSDGNLEMLGRRDFQVQLRGIRIELAGIEKSVQELGLAAQCAVVARAFGQDDVRLVAFVVKPSESGIAAFRRALAAELPDYMLPHHLVVLDAMPLTANGKLDRNGLKEMPIAAREQGERRKRPTNEREQKIAEVFARVLGLAEVGIDESSFGIDESFFDLGGDSLKGVVLLEEIQRATGVSIPPSVLFDSGTVEALARQTASGVPTKPRPILLNSKVSGTPLFMLSGVHIYRKLARRLEGRCSAYGVFTQREVGSFNPASKEHSVHDLARDYLEMIRAEQPVGPYRLLGYSFAGIVAYEVAQQIRASGGEVSLLVLLDTFLPEWLQGWTYRLDQMARLATAPPRDVFNFLLSRLRGKWNEVEFEGLHQNDKELGPMERRRDTVNMAAAGEYMSKLQTYDGNVTLIMSSARLQHDPLKNRSGGWSPYIRSLDIQSVRAHHLRMISDEPHVSEVAAILEKRINGTTQ
jgi:amino acid adenylation domain-containing protein